MLNISTQISIKILSLLLKSKYSLTRTEISNRLNIARSTIFDNLVILERLGQIESYTNSRNSQTKIKSGRNRIYFRINKQDNKINEINY